MPKKAHRKRYNPQEKARIVVEVLKEEKTLAQLASAYGVHSNQLRRWRSQALALLPRVFEDEPQAVRDLEAQFAQERETLYAEIGRLTTQLTWLKKKSGLDVESR
jgi:transposase-like protein